MASVKDITAELMKKDLYAMLGVESTAGERVIKKAYRKQALKCHPDKNPDDPKAAEMFMKLSKALEILCDADARQIYDRVLKARQATTVRNRQYDSKRRKLKDDLEAREKAAEANKAEVRLDVAKMQEEIERLRKQGSRQLEEEQELMRQQLREEREGLTATEPADDDGVSCRLKVRWKGTGAESAEAYDQNKLSALFSKYGEVVAIVVSQKKRGSALVEFSDSGAAENAAKSERGTADNPLTAELIDPRQKTAKPSSGISSSSSAPPMSKSSFDTFENLVLRNLRQAEERKRLAEELKNEDD